MSNAKNKTNIWFYFHVDTKYNRVYRIRGIVQGNDVQKNLERNYLEQIWLIEWIQQTRCIKSIIKRSNNQESYCIRISLERKLRGCKRDGSLHRVNFFRLNNVNWVTYKLSSSPKRKNACEFFVRFGCIAAKYFGAFRLQNVVREIACNMCKAYIIKFRRSSPVFYATATGRWPFQLRAGL